MIKRIVLNEPSFTPADDQVIYMEWQPNGGVNAFIRKHYEWLRELFLFYGLNFCYLPILGKEVIRYNAPYLTDEECEKILASMPSLQDCVVKNDEVRGPVLAFSAGKMDSETPDSILLHCIEIEKKWFKPTKSIFKQLAKEIDKFRKELEQSVVSEPAVQYGGSDIRFSLREDDSSIVEEYGEDEDVLSTTIDTNDKRPSFRHSPDIRFSVDPSIKEADETFDEQAKVLVKEIKERINALRNCGVNTMFLHNIIDENKKLSRLVITKDYRIFLPDYDNMEIEMAALPKAVFLLFLKHPEGIRFKELPEYYDELLQIYLSLNPMGSRQRQEDSIKNVTDPLGNSINEKCARVRSAFISKFDDGLAQNYYITGKRGETKRITLDKKLIVWEQ